MMKRQKIGLKDKTGKDIRENHIVKFIFDGTPMYDIVKTRGIDSYFISHFDSGYFGGAHAFRYNKICKVLGTVKNRNLLAKVFDFSADKLTKEICEEVITMKI